MIDVDLVFSQFLNSQSSLTALTSNRIWRISAPNTYKVSDGTSLIFSVDNIESRNPIYQDKILDLEITLRGYASNANQLRDLHRVLMAIFAGKSIKTGSNFLIGNELNGGQILREFDTENWTMLLFLSTTLT